MQVPFVRPRPAPKRHTVDLEVGQQRKLFAATAWRSMGAGYHWERTSSVERVERRLVANSGISRGKSPEPSRYTEAVCIGVSAACLRAGYG